MREDNCERSSESKVEEEEEKERVIKRSTMDDDSSSSKPDSKSLQEEPKSEIQTPKRRKVVQKSVVRVRIEADSGKQKNEGPPSDLWSWRKYGQKPIKGSPYPRGYYRCSTSKGCSAKKQVERCRTDATMLIITYTSCHNHPGPDLHTPNPSPLQEQEQQTPQIQTIPDLPTTPKQEQQQQHTITSHDDLHYFQPPINCSQDIIINQEDQNPLAAALEEANDSLSLLFDEEPLSYPNLMTFSTPKSEDNDFFDELEELPISSSFTSFMRTNFFDERILFLPS